MLILGDQRDEVRSNFLHYLRMLLHHVLTQYPNHANFACARTLLVATTAQRLVSAVTPASNLTTLQGALFVPKNLSQK